MPATRSQRSACRQRSNELATLKTASASSHCRTRPCVSQETSWRDESPLTNLSSASRSNSPTPASTTPKQVVIRGQTLTPTPVLDTLFHWLAERKAIDDRRREGMPAPWTEDPVLSEYKFCNAYRVLDRTTQFIISEVIEKGSHLSDTELLFRILLFNCFNRIETWELLEEAFGARLTWARFDLKAYGKVLSQAIADGVSLFTAAYMKIGKKIDHDANHMRHLQLLQILMRDLPVILRNAKYAADVFERVAAYQGLGDFAAFQLVIALSYSRLFNYSANDFVIAGLGASSGLVKIFGRSVTKAKEAVPHIEGDILRWLVTTQREHFARLNLEFSFLRNAKGQELELDLMDFEHAVCEVDKYARKAHPRIRGIGNRTQLRGSFNPSQSNPLPELVLPKAWEHPARRAVRVRRRPIQVEQRYVVSKIIAERESEANAKEKHGDEIEYLVSWQGYTDQTWEPRYAILDDAPTIVKEFHESLKTATTTKSSKKGRRARR
ncbi:chromo domain-containing protein [Favolaschia claudopus]|uniref:Chromo domain-containing protein n=1 Tax=Favolaschia claudopus TaxID=2862362 RepID=A0AAW0DQR3_9AGAR